MAAATTKSENVTIVEGSEDLGLDKKQGRLLSFIDQDSLATTATDDAGDITLFCPIPSDLVILDVLILSDDLDSNGTPTLEGDWGLYYSGIGGDQKKDGNTSGTVIDANCFADADTNLQSATTTWTSVRFATDNIVDVKKEAWEVAGLTSDPGGIFYVGFTVGTGAATGAAGDVVVRVDGLY